MSVIFGLLFFLFSSSRADNNSTLCDGIEAKTFNLANVLGSWYVVGVVTYGQNIPEKANPCFRVEFSEADEAGLQWLLKNLTHFENGNDWSERVKGTTIRQRYHIDHPYDTWSKVINETKGCFQEVLTIYSDDNNTYKTAEEDMLKATMQLHLIITEDGLGPYLMQLLWGEKISAIIYRRRPGRVTKQELEPTMTLINKIRTGQELKYICNKTPKVKKF